MKQETKQTILTGTVIERAVVYARVSGDDRKYSTSGIEGQLADCKKYAEDKRYNVVAEFYEEPDKQTSGYDWLPELQKILALAEKGSFDVLIVREVDRLARNRFKQMSVENHLESYGIRVEYVIGQYQDTAEGRLLKGLMGEFAEFEKNKIAERTFRGWVKAIKSGKVPKSALTYGYDIVDREMIINEYEAGIVQTIFNLYVNENYGLLAIAEWLDSHEIEKPAKRECHIASAKEGTGWSIGTINGILVNETYVGRWHYRKYKTVKSPKTGKRKQIKRPKEEWLTVEVPAIIPEDIFKAVQLRKAENKRQRGKRRKHDYLIGGMVTCGHCAANASGITRDWEKGYSYYRCNAAHFALRYGYKCENSSGYKSQDVDRLIWQWIRGILLDTNKRQEALAEYQKAQEGKQGPSLKMIEANENKLNDLEGQKDRLIKAYKAGILSLDEIAKEKEAIDKQIAGLEGAIEELKGNLGPALLSEEDELCINRVANDLQTGAMEADKDFEKRRKLLKALRTQVTLLLIDGEKWVKTRCVLGEATLSTDYISAPGTVTVTTVY